MGGRVAIVGTYQSRYEAEKRGYHITELVYEVVSGLLEKLGMDIKDVDNIVSCSQDFLDGRTISNRTIPEAEGAYLKSEAKVAGDGAHAVFYGMVRILSGNYRTCLVLAHAKMSEGAQNIIANAMFDPFYQRALGLDEVISAALQAKVYMHRYKISPEKTAKAAAKSLSQALNNEYVFRGRMTSIEDVLNSRVLASPIHELDAYTVADGACALMLASEELSKSLTKAPVFISGAGIAMNSYYLGERDLGYDIALENAAKKAYRMAGIKDPKKELDLLEISNYFSYQELLFPEALGLCEKGKGAELVDSGETMPEGSLPINPSGGVLAGNPLCVAGMARVIEATRQILGEAGKCQVKKRVSKALAQGSYGPCAQNQCVLILTEG